MVQLNGSAYTIDSQINITNEDTFDWEALDLEINSPNILGDGYRVKYPFLGAGKSCSLGCRQFAKADGTRFNPLTTKVMKLNIFCGTPKGYLLLTWDK